MKPACIVTPEYLLDQITTDPQRVIGRALLAIYNRQTLDEQSGQTTINLNGIGFTAFDANLGTRCAKYFADYHQLQEWMVKCWLKPVGKKQQPKILKYQ